MNITHNDHDWREVSRDAPCPICGKGDWCGKSGDAHRCMRIADAPSGWNAIKHHDDGGVTFKPIDGSTPTTMPQAKSIGKPRTIHPTRERAEAAALWSIEQRQGAGWTLAQRFVYPNGYVVLRFERGDDKTFAPIHTEAGGWALGDPSGKLPLYRRGELGEGIVIVVEGEGVVEAARSIGLNATTSAHGSKSARRTDWSALAERNIAIFPDADEPGERYAQDVATILHALDCTIRIVRLEGLDDGGDLADWIAARDAIETDALRDEIHRLAEAAPLWTPAPADQDKAVQHDDRVFALTDTGNAERLVGMFGQSLRYCAAWGTWLVWSGVRWQRDVSGEVEQYAKRAVRAMYRQAAELDDSAARAALADWARASESAHRRAAMMKLAQSEPAVAVKVDQLDADPMLLNCATCTIDLRTGELREHDPGDLITKLAPVAIDMEGACPVYECFVNRIFDGDADLIEYVERFIGYALTGDTRHHLLFIPWGDGANGKSTLFDLVLGIMGDYAAPAPDSLLTARAHDEHATEVAGLHGLRLTIASETDEGKKLRVGMVKKLTGDAKLTGRFMRRDYFDFTRTHKTILVTNNRPRVSEDSTAVWRRLRLIPFTITIPDAEQDRELPEKLKAEAPAILARWVRACLRWQADGHDLAEPQAVVSATDDYRGNEDVLAEFLASDCIIGNGYRASRGDLWQAYQRWADRERIPYPLAQHGLYDRLRRIEGVNESYITQGGRGRKGFDGIGIALRGPSNE